MPGLEIALGGDVRIQLTPLHGHTRGHCGVALSYGSRRLFHAADGYYRRLELGPGHSSETDFPSITAENNQARIACLDTIANTVATVENISLFCTHDLTEKAAA